MNTLTTLNFYNRHLEALLNLPKMVCHISDTFQHLPSQLRPTSEVH